MLKIVTPPVSHIVYQTAPDGIVTPAYFYNAAHSSVVMWVRSMREDNPDYKYEMFSVA